MIFEKSTVKHLTFHELSSCLMRLSRGFSTTQHLITIEAYNSLYNLYYGLWNYQRILNTESQVIHNKIVTWQSYLSSVTCILPTKVLHEPTPLLLYKLIICDSENYYCNTPEGNMGCIYIKMLDITCLNVRQSLFLTWTTIWGRTWTTIWYITWTTI